LTETSGSSESIDGVSVFVIHYVNSTGGVVVMYYLPILNATVPPGKLTEYSLTFATNSTFSGVYEYASISGSYAFLGLAGISGTEYYHVFTRGGSNNATFDYLVPLGSFQPYVLGASNSYNSSQILTITLAVMGSCGGSWLSQVTET
jgi:hypothetical protein